MKRKSFGLLILMCLLAPVLAACGSAPQPQQTAGKLADGVYSVPGIGMKVVLPDGFEAFEGKALDSALGEGTGSFYRFGARNSDKQQAILFFVVTDQISVDGYMADARKQLLETRDTVSEIGDLEVSGFAFKTLYSQTASEQGEPVSELCLAYEKDGAIYGLNEIYRPEDEDSVLSGVSNIILPMTAEEIEAMTPKGRD